MKLLKLLGRTSIIAGLGLLSLAARAPADTGGPPSVVLITLDTTRADRMGFLDCKRGLTPNLDELARQSVVFTRAYAQAPMTATSHASILTGTYPQFHHVLDFGYPLSSDLPYLPATLRARGYHTAAFVGSLVLDASAYAPGFDRGFDTYDAPFHSSHPGNGSDFRASRRGSEVVAGAVAWLNQHSKGPFFLWVHLYDAHDPYDPPEPFRTRYASQPYDGGIAYEDSVVGELLRELKTRGLYEGTAIAVLADHGESLGAHGEETHGVFLYDETIRVPLLIKLPGEAAAGRRIEQRVETIDVLPTLLQAAKVEVPAAVQGRSLLELMQAGRAAAQNQDGAAGTWRDRPAYAQSDYPRLAYGLSALQSLRAGKYLYIQAPRRELYDEGADANAEHNLAKEKNGVADTLQNQLGEFQRETSGKGEPAKAAAADPAAQEKLLALGYASGNELPKPEAAGHDEGGADPKDNIKAIQVVTQVPRLLAAQNYDAALSLLQQAIARKPDMAVYYVQLGECYKRLRQFDKAVPPLRRAVELTPNSLLARMQLGLALEYSSDFAGAIPEFEKVVAAMPRVANWRLELASDYARVGRWPQAIQQYRELLTTDPDNFFAHLLLGHALLQSGDAAGALTSLKRAAALHPTDPLPHSMLASLYDRLGQEAEAEHEKAEATRLASERKSEQR